MLGIDLFLLILILNVTAVIRYDVTKSDAFKNDVELAKGLYNRLTLFIHGK